MSEKLVEKLSDIIFEFEKRIQRQVPASPLLAKAIATHFPAIAKEEGYVKVENLEVDTVKFEEALRKAGVDNWLMVSGIVSKIRIADSLKTREASDGKEKEGKFGGVDT